VRTDRLTFDNDRGESLAARLDRPLRDTPLGYALFAHCFTCSKNIGAAVQMSRALVAQGWAVLRFDFTGLGDSEGDFGDTHFSSNVSDLVSAARWLEQHHAAPRLLVGHSLGGAAVLCAASQLESVVAVATVGAPGHPEHVLNMMTTQIEAIERDGTAEVVLGGRRFQIKQEFVRDIQEQPMQRTVASLRRALLVMHAPKDEVVGIDNASQIFGAAKHPKSFVSLDDADHLLSRSQDAQYVASVIVAWAQRYLPEPALDSPDGESVTAWGPVRGFRTELQVGPHHTVADEPKEVGGTEAGPSPYGHLLSALGACTAMTLRMYADRKRWPLEQAVVKLHHAKVHARDCEECDRSAAGKIDRIERTVELVGEALTTEQRERLHEIADKCPVHRTLTSGAVVVGRSGDSDATLP